MIIRVRAQKPSSAPHVDVDPMRVQLRQRPMRILDFDIENRPLSYLGSDFTTAEVTAIAWAWTDEPQDVTVHLLGESDLDQILLAFLDVYEEADMVTGHFIRGHDLPMINGALVEIGFPVLGDKLTHDTKQDLVRAKGISRSQESLGAMLQIDEQKVQMNQAKWRAANRLTREGLDAVRERVGSDVRQHIALRQRLLDLGYLAAPKMWKSGNAPAEPYTP